MRIVPCAISIPSVGVCCFLHSVRESHATIRRSSVQCFGGRPKPRYHSSAPERRCHVGLHAEFILHFTSLIDFTVIPIGSNGTTTGAMPPMISLLAPIMVPASSTSRRIRPQTTVGLAIPACHKLHFINLDYIVKVKIQEEGLVDGVWYVTGKNTERLGK